MSAYRNITQKATTKAAFNLSSQTKILPLEDPRETVILNITSTPLALLLSFICSSAHQYFSASPMAQTNHRLVEADDTWTCLQCRGMNISDGSSDVLCKTPCMNSISPSRRRFECGGFLWRSKSDQKNKQKKREVKIKKCLLILMT